MRLIGIVLIMAGLFFSIAQPWFSSNFTGEEIAREAIFERKNKNQENRGWQVASIFLEQKNNPHRIRFEVKRLPGQFYDGPSMNLLVRVAPISQSGQTLAPVFNEQVHINLENTTSGTLPGTNAKLTTVSTDDFPISQTGQYKIGAFPIPKGNVSGNAPNLKIDANILSIESVVSGAVEPVGSGGVVRGFAMVALGIVIVSFSGRRKRRARNREKTQPQPQSKSDSNAELDATQKAPKSKELPKSNEPSKPAPETDVGKTIKWGRDAGKKR